MRFQALSLSMAVLLASLASAAEVRLRSSAVCSSPIVRLADTAEILGDDKALNQVLGAVALCPAPASGSERTLSQHQVRQLLALSDVDRGQFIVTGSEQVVLKGDATSPDSRPKKSKHGPVRQALYMTDAGAARAKPMSPPALPAPAPLVSAAKPAKLVERGAAVTVYSRKAGVHITTSGTALQAGVAGEMISVEIEPKQRVLARVVGMQQVEVGASAPAAANP